MIEMHNIYPCLFCDVVIYFERMLKRTQEFLSVGANFVAECQVTKDLAGMYKVSGNKKIHVLKTRIQKFLSACIICI